MAEQRVRFRLERQQTRADVTVILGEAALQLTVGSPEVMAEQIDHLRRTSPTVLVLPFRRRRVPVQRQLRVARLRRRGVAVTEWIKASMSVDQGSCCRASDRRRNDRSA